MAGQDDELDDEDFRGRRFTGVDLSDAVFRDCNLRRVKITDSWLSGVSLSGIVGNLRVNDVDVGPFVEAELDRRNPERVQLRAVSGADDHRAMWATLEDLWAATVDRARKLPDAVLDEQVDEEYSFTETLRHLIFATDAWIGRTIPEEPLPFHPLALPQDAYPPDLARAIGIDVDARPTIDEVLAARAERMALVRGIVGGLTGADLARPCPRSPAPGYPDEPRTVATCLGVVIEEECEHRRYANRDLSVLEERG